MTSFLSFWVPAAMVIIIATKVLYEVCLFISNVASESFARFMIFGFAAWGFMLWVLYTTNNLSIGD